MAWAFWPHQCCLGPLKLTLCLLDALPAKTFLPTRLRACPCCMTPEVEASPNAMAVQATASSPGNNPEIETRSMGGQESSGRRITARLISGGVRSPCAPPPKQRSLGMGLLRVHNDQ